MIRHQAASVFAGLTISAGCRLAFSQKPAQAPAEKKPAVFEVASVRPGQTGAPYGVPKPMPGGQRFVAANSPLMIMVMSAYELTFSQISGAPKWMISDPWNLDAKADHASTMEQLQEMLRSLLADRFNLRFHRETKEAAAYVLSVERSGSRLKFSDSRNPFDEPIKSGDRPSVRVGTRVSMSYLCWYLSFNFDAPVVNKTGLAGYYDFTLDVQPPSPLRQLRETPGSAPATDFLDRNTDLIAALNRVGLRLDRRKAPVDIIVIDHVDRPSEN